MEKTITLTAEQADFLFQVVGRYQGLLVAETQANDYLDPSHPTWLAIGKAGELMNLIR